VTAQEWGEHGGYDAPLATVRAHGPVTFGHQTLLVRPQQGWERLKGGAGTPPLRTPRGCLVFYHGVEGQCGARCEPPRRYSAGILLLAACDPRKVVYRSADSILAPDVPAELVGVVPGVVFPMGGDVRRDGWLDVYYAMADSRIGVAYAGLADLLMPAQAHAA
jgi:predicted GH43/DUF377 family glycosyl hydrolase